MLVGISFSLILTEYIYASRTTVQSLRLQHTIHSLRKLVKTLHVLNIQVVLPSIDHRQ